MAELEMTVVAQCVETKAQRTFCASTRATNSSFYFSKAGRRQGTLAECSKRRRRQLQKRNEPRKVTLGSPNTLWALSSTPRFRSRAITYPVSRTNRAPARRRASYPLNARRPMPSHLMTLIRLFAASKSRPVIGSIGRSMSRLLITLGILLVAVGPAWPLLAKLGLGHCRETSYRAR